MSINNTINRAREYYIAARNARNAYEAQLAAERADIEAQRNAGAAVIVCRRAATGDSSDLLAAWGEVNRAYRPYDLLDEIRDCYIGAGPAEVEHLERCRKAMHAIVRQFSDAIEGPTPDDIGDNLKAGFDATGSYRLLDLAVSR